MHFWFAAVLRTLQLTVVQGRALPSPALRPWAARPLSLVRYGSYTETLNTHLSGCFWHNYIWCCVFRWWENYRLKLCVLGRLKLTTTWISPRTMWSRFWSSRRAGGWEICTEDRAGFLKPMLQSSTAVTHLQSKLQLKSHRKSILLKNIKCCVFKFHLFLLYSCSDGFEPAAADVSSLEGEKLLTHFSSLTFSSLTGVFG